MVTAQVLAAASTGRNAQARPAVPRRPRRVLAVPEPIDLAVWIRDHLRARWGAEQEVQAPAMVARVAPVLAVDLIVDRLPGQARVALALAAAPVAPRPQPVPVAAVVVAVVLAQADLGARATDTFT